METKQQTISQPREAENRHDGGFTYHERHGVDFRPLHKLTTEEPGPGQVLQV